MHARSVYSSSYTFEPNGPVYTPQTPTLQVPMLLRDAGASRITFVGGEPFLHPLIEPLLAECKAQVGHQPGGAGMRVIDVRASVILLRLPKARACTCLTVYSSY